MNRDDAIAVLRKIMVSCISFYTAQSVAISEDKETQSWVLAVNWTPEPDECECLDKILNEYGLEVTAKNGRTVFQSLSKPK
jgi:hypothetical protein